MRFARQCGARVWAALRPLARDTEPTAEGEASGSLSLPTKRNLRARIRARQHPTEPTYERHKILPVETEEDRPCDERDKRDGREKNL